MPCLCGTPTLRGEYNSEVNGEMEKGRREDLKKKLKVIKISGLRLSKKNSKFLVPSSPGGKI